MMSWFGFIRGYCPLTRMTWALVGLELNHLHNSSVLRIIMNIDFCYYAAGCLSAEWFLGRSSGVHDEASLDPSCYQLL